MKSMLGQLLFGQITVPKVPGRTVRFDREELDMVLATGPMEDRVASLLLQAKFAMTASDIAAALQSNASQVTRGLRKLIDAECVEIIDIAGCPREYKLVANFKSEKALASHLRVSTNQA